MKRAFLYIDILGFGTLVKTNPEKVDKIFEVIDSLRAHHHFALKIVVFSDTILVFNKNESRSLDYYVTYLIEYVQELFYNLCNINIYFKGIITHGEFKYSQLRNIEAYYGLALVDTHEDEKHLEGFGLFIDKSITDEVVVFDVTDYTDKYNFIILCQYLQNLYKHTQGVLPVEHDLLTDTDTYYRVDEDLKFLREITYLKDNHPLDRAKAKYQKVYDTYKSIMPLFFELFEREGFLPWLINEYYTGNYNPFDLISENELSGSAK
ncbi:hypothetical protein [Pedobacter sp. L105]|uniref:hypothetical protein n=1 Tax=Pedobacter sp. L105 TaxID=1641871 RepID=UPI00131C46E0|nr:hypothetical protein [Pedobacter sp. L105]